jgi:hypothetical protein
MSEETKVDYAEVRAFLDAQGYRITEPDTKRSKYPVWLVIRREYPDIEFVRSDTSQEKVYRQSLNHFLCHWLGVRWSKGAFHAIDYAREEKGHDYGFEPDEWQTIEKAIAYYEALDAE